MGWPNNFVQGVYDSTGKVVGVEDGVGGSIAFSSRMILSNIMGRQWNKRQTIVSAASNVTAYTYHQTFTIEAHATRFRILLQNASLTEIMTVTAGSIAVSNAIGTDSATNTTPSTATFVPLTWNGGATSVAVPVATAANRPKLQWSDWIDISTIARTDGGTLPVVMVRIYINSGTTFSRGTYSLEMFKYNSIAGLNNGRFANTWRSTGDKVTGSPSMGSPTLLGYTYVMGVEYASRQAGLTIYAEGDSITDGNTNGGDEASYGNSWIWQAINLMRNLYPNIPIDLVNGGIGSSGSLSFLNRFNDVVASGQHFDMLIYSPFTPNDATPSQLVCDNQYRYYSQISDVMANAKKPHVITTPFPNGTIAQPALAWTAPQDAFRLAQRTDILSNRYSGIDVIDVEPVISTMASPARYIESLCTDGTHPNDSGYAAVAAVALPILSKYLPFSNE